MLERINQFYAVNNIAVDCVSGFELCVRCDALDVIENCYNDIVTVLQEAASSCILALTKNFFKYWFDQELKMLKENSVATHRDWVAQGRPRQGYYFDLNKSAKYKYKSKLKEVKTDDRRSISNALHDALLAKNQSSFWKMWKSKFPSKRNTIPHSIDGDTDHTVIANKFAKTFEFCCQNKSDEECNKFKQLYADKIFNYYGDNFDKNNLLNVEKLDKVISELKRGKAASLDGLTAEHVINSHPVIVLLLVRLYNLMLCCSYVPDAFGVGLCVPLPKANNDKLNSVDGYRAITVSPILSKIFEIGIAENLDKYFKTSDMQFGFKKKLSCSHAIYSVRTAVEYFVNRGSTVNLCTMDLSKAFDRINHYCLFVKLIERHIPLLYILLLENWYCKIFIFVRWCDSLSSRVCLKAGVRQGGILSPLLFIVYVDEILQKLQLSNLGC